MLKHDEVKEELIATDTEFRRLYQEHQDHERRLDQLTRHHAHASESADETELKTLKIQKLRLKDRMEEMIRTRLDGGRLSA
jgi:uncharacterized protein YdcH (DUF465 family)